MATQTQPLANAKQADATSQDITKRGTSLETLQEVVLYKPVPIVPEITDNKDMLSRVNNDQKTIWKYVREALQLEAESKARADDAGWKMFDDKGQKTETTASGALVSPDILNPAVLSMCKMMTFPVLRNGQQVEISWDEAVDGTDEKASLKSQALAEIRNNKKMVESLKRRQAALEKGQK